MARAQRFLIPVNPRQAHRPKLKTQEQRRWMMRFLASAIAMGLFLAAGSEQAQEWSYLGDAGAGDDSYIAYIDRETMRRDANTARGWSLWDYTSTQSKPFGRFLSSRHLWEYDCADQRSHALQIAFFVGSMASGEIVHSSNSPSEWSYVAPGSIAEARMQAACGG
jgi:hypothetical protein